MIIWTVIWVVLMILWLFGGSYAYWPADRAAAPMYIGGTIIPWACVLILGLVLFGAVGGAPLR